jgi:hypothetical protein
LQWIDYRLAEVSVNIAKYKAALACLTAEAKQLVEQKKLILNPPARKPKAPVALRSSGLIPRGKRALKTPEERKADRRAYMANYMRGVRKDGSPVKKKYNEYSRDYRRRRREREKEAKSQTQTREAVL